MPRLNRRDRRIRAAHKRMIQQYTPDPVNILEPWNDDECEIVIDDTVIEEAEHEHA